MGLGTVLDDRQSMALGDPHHPRHIGHPAVQVDRHDRRRARPDGRLDRLGVDASPHGIDVHEARAGSRQEDPHPRSGGRHRRGDHLVAVPDAAGAQRQTDRIRPRIDADAMRDPDVCGEALLELVQPLAEHQPAAGQHVTHRPLHFRREPFQPQLR